MFDKLQKRLEQKAERAFINAVDRTADAANAAIDVRTRIKALADDPDSSIGIESLVLVVIDTVRDENSGERPGSRKEVVAAYRSRQRLMRWISRLGPWGAAAGHLATLYSEAAILCDVADAGGLGLSREQLGASVLVLWGVMPDLDRALPALYGEDGRSTMDYLRSRLPIGHEQDDPDRMTKRQIVELLWKLRSLRASNVRAGKGAIEEMIASAEEQLFAQIERGALRPRASRHAPLAACSQRAAVNTSAPNVEGTVAASARRPSPSSDSQLASEE
jgi:hypothetical protein